MSHSRASRISDSVFYSSNDDYIRKNDASGFRQSLDVPTRTGGNASGTWGINITGNADASTNSRVDHDTGNAWHRPIFISDSQSSGSNQRLYSDSASTIGINPSSNQIRATTFVGGLSGNSTTATTATNIDVQADNSTNSTHYVIFTGSTSGSQRPQTDSTLYYNPSSNTLTAGTFNSTSDINLKKDITPINSALSRISNINGVNFTWKDSGLQTIGVIAQNVEEEFPELVTTGDVKSVNYHGLVGVLIEAVKELQAEVSQLKKSLK
jgi:hypothetical protein